jgi:glycosyltransferase involved in cell wall biosynthesis
MSELLHPELFNRMPIVGERMRRSLAVRAGEVATAATGQEDPYVSVMVRSKNNPNELDMLLQDVVHGQEYDQSKVQLVLVDTDPTPDTRAVAREYDATHVAIEQKDFSYPSALNKGFEAAEHPYVFTFVDHSLLSNDQTLRTATRWHGSPDFAGAFGVALPNANATRTEWVGAVLLRVPKVLGSAALRVTQPTMGFMAANSSVVSKEAWAEVGGYDESFGAGGEDGDFGQRLIAANGAVILDPALSVHHTHGLGPINGFRQFRAWSHMGDPATFDRAALEQYRPDLK